MSYIFLEDLWGPILNFIYKNFQKNKVRNIYCCYLSSLFYLFSTDFIFLLALISGIWFKTSHIGNNRMKTFMKDICHITGVDLRNRHITNHSDRKTLIQILQKNEKGRADIVKVT